MTSRDAISIDPKPSKAKPGARMFEKGDYPSSWMVAGGRSTSEREELGTLRKIWTRKTQTLKKETCSP